MEATGASATALAEALLAAVLSGVDAAVAVSSRAGLTDKGGRFSAAQRADGSISTASAIGVSRNGGIRKDCY